MTGSKSLFYTFHLSVRFITFFFSYNIDKIMKIYLNKGLFVIIGGNPSCVSVIHRFLALGYRGFIMSDGATSMQIPRGSNRMLEGMMMNFFNVPMNVRNHCNRQVCCTNCCTMIKKYSLTYQEFSVNGYMNVAVKYQRIINERSLFIEVI